MLKAIDIGYQTPDGRTLATGLCFEVNAGELLAIRGPNGSGKTTLLQILLGQRSPLTGQVKVDCSPDEMAYLPQLQNVRFHLPMHLRDVLSIAVGRTVQDAAVDELNILSAQDLERAWNSASGGERQRTLICRTLLQQPKILVLDEPFNHLDQVSIEKVSQAIHQFLDRPQRAAIMVTHGEDEMSHLAAGRRKVVTLGAASHHRSSAL